MIGTVQEVTKSKSGRAWRVNVEGKWYGAFLDSGVDGAVGKRIDFTYKSDPKFGDQITKWGYAGGNGNGATAPVGAPQAPASNGPLTEPELRFCSNVVGQAILAKTLTDPEMIGLWAKAARQALKELA